MENNASVEKGRKWSEYDARQYIAALREEQKKEPALQVLRAKTNELACELYLDKYSCLEISEMISINVRTVYNVLRRNNLYKKNDRGFPKKLKDKVARLYKQGREIPEIRDSLQVTSASVRRILRQYNIPLRTARVRKERPDDKTMERAVQMYQEGKAYPKIKTATGVSVFHLYETLHKNNIPLRGDYRGKERIAAEEEALRLYCDTDTSTKAIEIKTGISHHIMARLLRQRNIPMRMPPKPTDKQIKKAVRMYQKGIMQREIKTITGVNDFYLYNAIHKLDIPMKDGKPVKTKERIAAENEAIRLYSETDTFMREIQEKTGIPIVTLGRMLKERNIPLRGRPLIEKDQREEALRLYHEGLSFSAIYKKTGVSPGGLSWILQSGKIPLRGKKVIDQATKKMVISMYKKGYAIAEIRDKTGVKGVHEVLKKYKVPATRNRSGKF